VGISEDAARVRTDRALEKLRTLLARRGWQCWHFRRSHHIYDHENSHHRDS
jgi:predicted RNA binding protein YcfA (HicA-like mRNA interferase family)